MTTPIALPVSSLLPPVGEAHPSDAAALPSPAAVLGPLPPTAPLSIAASFISSADLPPFEDTKAQQEDEVPARVLVITGPRADWHATLEDMDPEWIRTPSPDLSTALQRTDIRYVPTAAHARLLLTLMNSTPSDESTHNVPPPALVILWDIGSLLLEEQSDGTAGESDDGADGSARGQEITFAPTTTIATYLDLISAALDTARHLGDGTPLPLLVLEPRLAPDTSLPILAPGEGSRVPAASRTARVTIKDGLERLLGAGSVGTVVAESTDDPDTTEYHLELAGETYTISKTPGIRAEFATPPGADRRGGWAWRWAD